MPQTEKYTFSNVVLQKRTILREVIFEMFSTPIHQRASSETSTETRA